MRRGLTARALLLMLVVAAPATAAVPAARSRRSVMSDPRSAVLIVLGAIAVLGGGRKWLQVVRARRGVDRLRAPDVSPGDVLAAADHGREGLLELFRLLDTTPDAAVREAAGRALARLWARDQLIAEEEQAVVTRGFAVTWRARRRFPRGLTAPIPVEVRFGVPFLRDDGLGIKPGDLEWSYRLTGAERARLETCSPWAAGPGRVAFTLEPGDFPTNGPHQLVLQARARTVGLTVSWQLDLPHVPFTFAFDPILQVDALLTLPDAARGEAIARAVRLEPSVPSEGGSRFLDLPGELALRDPPVIAVTTPLPCDLAYAIQVEFEGIPGQFPAGSLVLGGQGAGGPSEVRTFPLGPLLSSLPADAIGHPGERQVRVRLEPDPDLGWVDPDVRAIWPRAMETGWCPVWVIRR